MSITLHLVSPAATPALRRGLFPAADDALDARAIAQIEAWRQRWPLPLGAQLWSSPELNARETARAAGSDARIEPALADIDYGRWRGQRLAEVAAQENAAFAAWLRDPHAEPGGGESFARAAARIGAWLESLAASDIDGTLVAFAAASPIRAALVHALRAPLASFSAIEIAPLSVTTLRLGKQGLAWVAASS